MDATVVPTRHSRWPAVGLGLVIAWLWAWTLFAYTFDLPRQIFTLQNLGMQTKQLLRLLADWHLWALATALLVAVASWRVRRLRVVGVAGLVAVPAVLLMGLYLQMGLSVREVRLMTADWKAVAEQ